MLTIFSCPKPFHGHINIIQCNAIKSWTLLQPRPEIILIGDEEGTEEVCREFGLRHVIDVERNESGTPLVSSIFHIGQSLANNLYACYVNADIILLNEFMEASQRVMQLMDGDSADGCSVNAGVGGLSQKEEMKLPCFNRPEGRYFLVVGRRCNLDLSKPLDFNDIHWESKLRAYQRSRGKLASPWAIDYFLFPVGLYKNILPFALGRCYWDNWLVYGVYSRGIRIIDITPTAAVIHQNHDYSHIAGGEVGLRKGMEMRRNWELQGGYYSRIFNIWDSTHVLSKSLKKASLLRHLGAHWIRLRYFLIILLVETLYPFSLPLVILLRGIRGCFRLIQRILGQARAKPA